MPASSFSADLWASGTETYAAILRHPFITGLSDGTLSREAFGYFIVQDSHYLRSYSRALALVSARATRDDEVEMFARHAAEAVAGEQALHAVLLEELGLTRADVDRIGAGPTTTAYMSYLMAVCATGSYAEGIAAVLPCYWIYRDVGRELLRASSSDPLYRTWIEAYGASDFDEVVESVLTVADRVGEDLGPAERERCRQHFSMTSRYEWMFWDAAHTQLAWPL